MADPGAASKPPHTSQHCDSEGHLDAAIERFNQDQMISLVDSVLPFEACLYYQVLPLSIESAQLNLGMVNLDDTAATDYVRRQVAYIHYSITTWPITSDWHREMLSKYLSQKAKTKPKSASSANPPDNQAAQGSPAVNPADQATYIVDTPSTLASAADDSRPSQPNAGGVSSPPSGHHRQGNHNTPSAASPDRERHQPLALDLPSQHLPTSLATMGKLPPKTMMQALLNRVLQDGIGRLYFERRDKVGRILWSKDGIVQAALENLSLPLFQSVINEFKRLTHLPLLPTTSSRQVEIERTYRQERVVLRFRLIAGTHGEEATLQVLRGAALKFYQQQQIDQLGRDALTFAHRLQAQIEQIRDRSGQTFTMEGTPATTLTTISKLLKNIDTEIHRLIQHHEIE